MGSKLIYSNNKKNENFTFYFPTNCMSLRFKKLLISCVTFEKHIYFAEKNVFFLLNFKLHKKCKVIFILTTYFLSHHWKFNLKKCLKTNMFFVTSRFLYLRQLIHRNEKTADIFFQRKSFYRLTQKYLTLKKLTFFCVTAE